MKKRSILFHCFYSEMRQKQKKRTEKFGGAEERKKKKVELTRQEGRGSE
jgi:hypothetical protein